MNGAELRPKILRREICHDCGVEIWFCRGAGLMPIHPRAVLGGRFQPTRDGSIQWSQPDPAVPGYEAHYKLCAPGTRSLVERRRLKAIDDAVAAALEEAKRPPPAEQLDLFPRPRPRWKEGVVDLTDDRNLPAGKGPRDPIAVDDRVLRPPARSN